MSLIDDIESMHQHIADAYDVIAAGGGGVYRREESC